MVLIERLVVDKDAQIVYVTHPNYDARFGIPEEYRGWWCRAGRKAKAHLLRRIYGDELLKANRWKRSPK
jgi:hypothetical protein